MSKKIKLLGCLFSMLIAPVAYGCSRIVTPITQFDSDEYILVGAVVGFIGPQKLKFSPGEASGVLVRAGEVVHLPKRSPGYFEVFPLDLESDCSYQGRSKEQVAGDYPIGSKVLIIAKEPKLDATSNGNVRLVIFPASNSLFSTIRGQMDQFSATSVYDYRAHADPQAVLSIFEMRKDLLRLKQASSEEEKERILRRLLYFPARFSIDYNTIVNLHLKDQGIGTQLIAEREAWKRGHKPRN